MGKRGDGVWAPLPGGELEAFDSVGLYGGGVGDFSICCSCGNLASDGWIEDVAALASVDAARVALEVIDRMEAAVEAR